MNYNCFGKTVINFSSYANYMGIGIQSNYYLYLFSNKASENYFNKVKNNDINQYFKTLMFL